GLPGTSPGAARSRSCRSAPARWWSWRWRRASASSRGIPPAKPARLSASYGENAMRKLLLAGTVVLFAIVPGAAQMDTQRFKPLTPETMTPEQKEVADKIMAGPRKGMRGPLNALRRSSELADYAQNLGDYVRFKSRIPPCLNELAILLTARRWTAQYEWYAQHRLAMQAGLSPDIAAAI